MQQRYYDPRVGRFWSVDPVTVDSVGGNFNRYWYGNNNPYKFKDPDGRFVDVVADIAFIVSDINDIRNEGLGWTNGAALVADVVGAFTPGATGLGLGVKGLAAMAPIAIKAGKAVDVGKPATKLGDFKVASKASLKGVNEHAVKRSIMGDRAAVKTHNISLDKNGNVLLRSRRVGK